MSNQVKHWHRTFLREQTDNKTLQIQAIGLSLYEPVEGITAEQIGQEVIRTQWLTNAGKKILGKRVLIVDEVDDTRKTLGYALAELKKDVEEELLNHPEPERNALREATKFGIFVVHNKLKPKLAELPPGTPYYAGANGRLPLGMRVHDTGVMRKENLGLRYAIK
ncbi:xanthine phosphoribosyltransferase 1 [Moniliophthora roreri]|nr:xanthine phosphoribosyltransferase 1 [Moniliophthora roreri]